MRAGKNECLKNEDNDLEHELSYCGKLEKEIESDEVLRSMPKVKEKLNLLKETIEDTKDHDTLSKDNDARTGHKTADSSFFGSKRLYALLGTWLSAKCFR